MVIWVSYDIYIYIYIKTGWWFGTWLLFFHILRMSSSQLTHSFQRGWNHQPVWIQTLSEKVQKNLQIIVNYTPNTSWEGTWIHRVYIYIYIIIQVYIHIGISDICILYKWYGMILFNILFFWIQERGIPFLTNQRGILNTAQVMLIGDDHNSVVGVRLWLWNNGFDR